MSTTDAVISELTIEDKRAALNPFEDCPWNEFLDELTYGYMQGERDAWIPIADVHKHWIAKFEAGDNTGILAHRDSLKTTFTLGYLAACLEYIDGFRAHWVTNTQEQAYKKADTEFWKLVERNPWLTKLNGPMRERSKSTKEWAHGSALYAGWLFGGIEGDRSHLLVLDDVIKERGDGDTEEILQWIEGVTVPMVKDSGKTTVIGTRKRPDDIYSHLIDRDAYDFTEYPAVLEEWDREFRDDDNWRERRPPEELYTEVDGRPLVEDTVHVLWPKARGPQYLADKFDQMSRHLFWREFCMVIRGASGNLVDADAVNVDVEDGGCSIRNRDPPQTYRASRGEVIVVGHDPANSPTGDDCAFSVWLRRRGGERVLLDARSEPGLSPSTVKAQLTAYDRRYEPATIIIESNGIQGYIVEDAIEFDDQLAAKVQGLDTGSKKHSWENGIPRLRTLVENGMVQFYRGHNPTEQFVTAMQSLKLDNGRLEGHTPDLVASWYMAEKALRRFDGRDHDREDDGSNGVNYL